MADELLTPDEDEILTPTQIRQMNHPFDVEGIKREMKKLLDKPKCRTFVKEILELVEKRAAPGNKVLDNGDLVKIFDRVVKQEKGGLVRAGDKAKGAIGGGSFASGRLRDGNARIQVGVISPGDDMTRKQAVQEYLLSDARYCIHETMHHASELGYSDEEFAIAVSIMTGKDLDLPDTADMFAFSDYWDAELRKSYE